MSDRLQVTAWVTAVRRTPEPDGPMDTQALYGEAFAAEEERNGWIRGRTEIDGYPGWIDAETAAQPVRPVTHRVSVLRTYAFSAPDVKSAPVALLSRNAKLSLCEDRDGRFRREARLGWFVDRHVAPLAAAAPDWVAVAEEFLHAPYLWGGKESLGLDCSGLIQTALEAAGVASPRDSEDQEQALGRPLSDQERLELKRGDLVFWRGHVGVMTDATNLLHANARAMAVTKEPLATYVDAIRADAGPITSIRRLPGGSAL